MMYLLPDFRFDDNPQKLEELRAFIRTNMGNTVAERACFWDNWEGAESLQRLEINQLMNNKLKEGALLVYGDDKGGYMYFDAQEDDDVIEDELSNPRPLTMSQLEEQVFESLFAVDDDREPNGY